MRVLLIEPSFDDNGAVRVSLDRAARWREKGVDVTVLFVCASGDGSRVEIPAGLPFVVANAKLRRMRWLLAGALARGLHLARRADVVVSGREIGSGLLVASTLARFARRPLAVTIHSHVEAALTKYGTPESVGHVLAALRDADLVVPVSGGLLAGLTGLGVSPERSRVVTNGVDVAQVRRAAAAEPPFAMPPAPVIVGVGRLSLEKGFDLLVRAHAMALRRGAPPHSLLILGEGAEREALTRLAAELGVSRSVRLAGFVPNPHSVVARADLFVLASRWEGFSLSLAEALCLGVPSISYDCVSGPAEVLDGGRFGTLVVPGDVDGLGAALAGYLIDPEPLRAAALAGKAVAPQRFDAAKAASDHLQLLAQLAARRSGSVPAGMVPWPKEIAR